MGVTKYVDLVEPTREEATQRAFAIQTFIEALLKGRLTPRRDRYGLIHYVFERRAGYSMVTEPLGRYDRAIRQLMNAAAPPTQALRRQIENVEVAWEAQPDNGVLTKGRILAILDRYINDPDQSPVRGAEWVRNAQSLDQRLKKRWKEEADRIGARERGSIAEWGVIPAAGGAHVTPPDLPALALE